MRRPSHVLEGLLLPGFALLSLLACGGPTAPVEPDTNGARTRDAVVAEPPVGCVDPVTTPPPPDVLMRRSIRNAAARGAVCNDGSAPSYYVRRGVGCGASRWVLFFEGGGACYPPDCPDRGQRLLSSNDDPATMEANRGLLSTRPAENPDFFTANQVFFSYCSSDAYSGDKSGSGLPGDYHFRGSRIVQAVIEDLVNPEVTPAPNLAQATELLLAGGSAGGAGVLFNLDRLGAAFPGKRVRGFTDAGWRVDTLQYDPALGTTVEAAAISAEFWNSVADASCSAAEPEQPGRCGVGQTLYPYLSTPLFVHQDQYDPVPLEKMGLTEPLDSSEQAFAVAHAWKVRQSLAPVSGVFSPADQQHTLVRSPAFNNPLVNGVSLRQAFGNWYFGRPGPTHVIE